MLRDLFVFAVALAVVCWEIVTGRIVDDAED
jgi:hypothetical protein